MIPQPSIADQPNGIAGGKKRHSVQDSLESSYEFKMRFEVEFDREEDGRWIAEIASLPGALAM